MKNFALLFGKCALALSLCMLFSGCSLFEFHEDPDEPETTETTERPNVSVHDPEGTVSVNMRIAGQGQTFVRPDNCFGSFYIGVDNNFIGYSYKFATIGSMNGIGNITKIPASGWADFASVRKGYGYVGASLQGAGVTFFRIYIDDYIISATTSGGVIGAYVKYHSPFTVKPDASSITVSKTEVTLSSPNYSEIITVSPYLNCWSAVSSEDWCNLYSTDLDKLRIFANYNSRGKTATVTIKMDGLPDRTIRVTVAN